MTGDEMWEMLLSQSGAIELRLTIEDQHRDAVRDALNQLVDRGVVFDIITFNVDPDTARMVTVEPSRGPS